MGKEGESEGIEEKGEGKGKKGGEEFLKET